jgi:peroxiredoxin
MRTTYSILSCIAVLSLTSACSAQEIPGPAVGERFPNSLEAPDQNGEQRTLAALYGDQGVALFFVRSADWCPYCREQLDDINARLDEFAALGLSVVSISVDTVEKIASFADAADIAYTMLADPEGAINESLGIRDPQYPVGSAAFGVPRPTLYIIDRRGIIRARYMEPTYRTRPDLDQVLTESGQLEL